METVGEEIVEGGGLPYVLLVHGAGAGVGAGHWQSWLAGELARVGGVVEVPQFAEPDRPDLGVWLGELSHHLEVAPRGERVVLAHGWGASLWLHHAAGLRGRHEENQLRVDRVLLVAPPGAGWHEPDVHGFVPTPLSAAGVRRAGAWTQMVVGDDDVACSVDEAVSMAGELGVDLDVIPRGGHLNAAAGYGVWPAVREWVMDRRARLRGNVVRA